MRKLVIEFRARATHLAITSPSYHDFFTKMAKLIIYKTKLYGNFAILGYHGEGATYRECLRKAVEDRINQTGIQPSP